MTGGLSVSQSVHPRWSRVAGVEAPAPLPSPTRIAAASPASFVRSTDRAARRALTYCPHGRMNLSRSLLGARGDSLIGAMDGWMDGWSDGQAEADSLERQKHELLELLGDVPLIAATTVAVSQLAARRMASPSVGEKGYLPLNTLNKMNRKRAQKGEREREREREKRREEERRGDRFFRCPVWHPRRSRARLSQNLLSIRAGRCTMLGRQRQAAAGGDGTVSERDRMTD